MPYDKEENRKKVYKICLETLEKEDVTTIEDLVTFLPIGRDTFYTYFPTDSEEFDIIKRAINKRKVKTKQLLRKVWRSQNSSPAERIFYYKLLANKEEKEAIYDTSIRAQTEAPKHEITLNLVKEEEQEED
ncbi:MAG: hypothetical protein EBV86_18210 [Marivivens sp.]|nr:hypothetical protein [Marivivens sp.]